MVDGTGPTVGGRLFCSGSSGHDRITGFAVLGAKRFRGPIFTWLYERPFVAHLESRARGAAYPAVTPPKFKAALILVPPEATLDEFIDGPGHVELMAVLRAQNTKLSRPATCCFPS